MRIVHDMHMHTTFSHGHHSIEEMVLASRKKGLEAITISDHGRNHPFFGVKPKNFKVMREEVDRMNDLYPDIRVYLGVEGNIIGSDGSVDIYDEELQYCDVLYAGYHYGYLPNNFKNWVGFAVPNVAGQFIRPIMKAMKDRNTETYLKMMDKYPLTMITHPGDKMPIHIAPVAQKAAEKGILLEINQHHDHLNAQELREAMQYPVSFAVNSDAHDRKDVGQIGRAEQIVREAELDPNRVINVAWGPKVGC